MTELQYTSAGPEAIHAGGRLWIGAPPFAIAVIAVLGLGAAHGEYFQTAWGWTVVAAVAVLAWPTTAGVLRRPTSLESVFVGALLALGCWFALSGIWGSSEHASDAVMRTLIYVAGAAVALTVVQRATVSALLAGTLAGSTALASYALASRLFADRIGSFDSVAGYRLSTPIGYWNALGLLCAIAALLALGLASATRSSVRAVLAGAPVPILLTTLYFTFSRGSWIALGVGLVVSLALDPRRARLSATALAVGAPTALAVFAASRSAALTHLQSAVALAAHDGHRLALLLIAFVIASGALAAAVPLVVDLLALPHVVSRVYSVALAVAGAQLARGQVAAAQASFDKAIAKDDGDWNLWFDLARATTGATRRAALAQATKLDPLSPEIAAFRSDLDAQSGISITAGGAKP